MKTLATCKPSEFLKQTNLIKKAVEHWLTVTKIHEIRKRLPELKKLTPDMSEDERKEAFEENKRRSEQQMMDNAMAILDAILEEHPDETLAILALACFVPPDKVDDHPIDFYLTAFTEIMSNQAVLGFFTSLARLVRTDTASASNQ